MHASICKSYNFSQGYVECRYMQVYCSLSIDHFSLLFHKASDLLPDDQSKNEANKDADAQGDQFMDYAKVSEKNNVRANVYSL